MKIYNTLTRTKEEFVPIEGNIVRIYSCGPTVYNLIHIGNARPLVVFDTLHKYLEHKGYEVIHVQNFTDVDDKIINKANEEGASSDVISKRYIEEALRDEKGLNIKNPNFRPLVTEEMQNIIEMVETLVQKEFAYEIDGTVYFNTKKSENYGKLSKKNIDELESGSRVNVDENKRNVSDFVLWKPAKEGEPFWASPWGNGRPGWHIECSAMIKRYLGDSIDIHAGGEDLVFPHHENEIAQSEAATGMPLAKYWMHNGFINVDNKKMSKSTGNFFMLREIVEQFSYDIVRFFIISAHYRMPINFSKEVLEASENSFNRIKKCAENIKHTVDYSEILEMTAEEKTLVEDAKIFRTNFERAMDDDLNTADAVTAVFDFVKFANIHVNEKSSIRFAQHLLEKFLRLTNILGLNVISDKKTGKHIEIEKKIEERQVAKKNKDFALADTIREELLGMGVVIEDTRGGVRWSFKDR